MDSVEWILGNLACRACTTDEMLYDSMESQSGRQLPLIYVPFDANSPGHWADRGSALDFALTAGPGKVLDFGPGDGWPSLIVAPYVEEVVGVDASKRRVRVCAENAERMGMGNAAFVHVPAGQGLRFEDASFDGAMAASSVENSPYPQSTLQEIFRVLRPGGKLRMRYEALGVYRGGRERELDTNADNEPYTSLVVFDRHIDEEWAQQFKLIFDLSQEEITQTFRSCGADVSFAGLTPVVLEKLCENLVDVQTCNTRHPSGPTLVNWLREIGFSSVAPTYDGAWFAERLLASVPPAQRPADMKDVDALLRPVTEVVVTMARPENADPMITATK